MAEIRFNARGEEFELGQVAWTRQLYGALASGSYIRQKYGQSPVIEKTPYQVKIRHASQDWTCRTCGQKIDEGDMHGSTFYDHYCLDCVTRSKPETEVEFLKPEVAPIKLYRTTRGFEEDAALRADLETKQGYKLYAVFDTPEEAQEVASQLTGQDIKFVKHISTPETGEHQTWEIYAKLIPQFEWQKPIKGEQAGMLGVPGKYVEQKRPWTPGQIEVESYLKYQEAMKAGELENVVDYDRHFSLEELKQMCKERGLPISGDKKTLARRLIGG